MASKKGQPTPTETLTPISLRTMTTRLNYERFVSDSHFRGSKLLHSTFADPVVINALYPTQRLILLDNEPASVNEAHLHVFRTDSVRRDGTLSTNDLICPDAVPEVEAMSLAQLELIYHESRDHESCYKALELYQHFYGLCPPGQKLSVQIQKEPPVLVDAFRRTIMEFELNRPKMLAISTWSGSWRGTIVTGSEQRSLDSVLAFTSPGSTNTYFVVDMTGMQWREAGRGSHGEEYFLGTADSFYNIMKNLCDGIEEVVSGAIHVRYSERTQRLKACAKKIWQRWENREKEGWCEYCSVGASERKALDCGACKEEKCNTAAWSIKMQIGSFIRWLAKSIRSS